MSEKDQAGHGIEVDPEKVDAHLTAGAMKKLKASEITEPGPYWVYDFDVVSDHPHYLSAPPDVFYHTKNFSFIKAEPPKVCRWIVPGLPGRYHTECGSTFSRARDPNMDDIKRCPYCAGYIEIEEE